MRYLFTSILLAALLTWGAGAVRTTYHRAVDPDAGHCTCDIHYGDHRQCPQQVHTMTATIDCETWAFRHKRR